MVHYVITIGRELGSGGKAIGELMAKELSIPVYDRRLILMAAEENGFDPAIFKQADETPSKGLMSQVIHSLSSPFAAFSSLYSNSMSNESLFKLQSDIILQKAQNEDCIIVGRDADVILHEKHPFRVYVCADMESRIARCMQYERKRAPEEQLSEKEILRNIRRIDKSRRQLREVLTAKAAGDGSTFDLTVNASGWEIKNLAEAVAEFSRRWFEHNEQKQY